jgi:hypothetical protein
MEERPVAFHSQVAETRHCEWPFDAACGGAPDKLPLRGSDEAIQMRGCDSLGTGLLRFARNDGACPQTWIGLPVTAIAASFIASEWVGWAWQV